MKKTIWPFILSVLFALATIGPWTTAGPIATAANLPAPAAPQSSAVNQFIIADHTVVDLYDDIPQQWIDEVKKMWLDIPGESHASGYRNGLELLESTDARFQVNAGDSGTPEAYTPLYLRVSGATWGDVDNDSGWVYSYGEEDWYTSALAVTRTQDHLTYANTHNLTVTALAFAWCWDMTWHNLSGGGIDPVYQVHWAGSSEGGPNGDMRWGLDAGDSALTGNSISMDTYLSATESYIAHNAANGFGTWVFFTTGPVEGTYDIDEEGYQRQLKHEYIRNYVKNSTDRILFDYADILTWGNDGTENTETWAGHTFPYIHADNMLDLDGSYSEDGDHIGERGAVRLAKAMWWLLARQAGWDGVIGAHRVSIASGDWSAASTWAGTVTPTALDAITITTGTTVTVNVNAQAQRLVVEAGATLIIPQNITLTVTDTVISRGTLQQTRPVNAGHVAFLELGDASRDIVRYRGLEISSTYDLGNVTVMVRDLSPTETCTTNGVTSPVYAQRCFEIDAQNSATSTVRLWTPTDQLNGVTQPRLYRYVAPNWIELTAKATTGSLGGYTYVQARTPGFSHFLIGQSGAAPTALTVSRLHADSPQADRWLWGMGLIVILLLAGIRLGWSRRARHPLPNEEHGD